MALKKKIMLVGAGRMAREHVKALRAIEAVEVVGVVGRSEERTKFFAEELGIDFYSTSLTQAYEILKPDGAVIAVSADQMYEVTRHALNHEGRLLVEKPPAMIVRECEDLVRESKLRGRDVTVGFSRRYVSTIAEARKQISDSSGKRWIEIHDQQDRNLIRSMGHSSQIVNHLMYANSIHLIDLIRFFARGEVTSVRAVEPWNEKSYSRVVSHVEFSSGDVALYVAHWELKGSWSVQVTLENEEFVLRPLEKLVVSRNKDPKREEIDLSEIDRKFKPGFYEQMRAWIRSFDGDYPIENTLEDSLKTMSLVEKIYN